MTRNQVECPCLLYTGIQLGCTAGIAINLLTCFPVRRRSLLAVFRYIFYSNRDFESFAGREIHDGANSGAVCHFDKMGFGF